MSIDEDEWERQQYDEDHGIHGDDEEDFEGDGGMVGSMMEAVLAHYEKGKCRQCNKEMEEKPPSESFCSEECRNRWQTLLDARIGIGLNDLRTRGYD